VLELLDSGKVFTSTSPEILALKLTMLARSEEWGRYFGFNFTADQAAISFLTRVAKRLGVKLHRSRSRIARGDGSKRPYQYQVMTAELVAEQIEVVKEQLAEDVDGSPDSLVALGRSLAALIDVQSSMVVRGALLRSALGRYEAAWSIVSIEESTMESMGQGGNEVGGAESLVA
jgi:hypothetical protein